MRFYIIFMIFSIYITFIFATTVNGRLDSPTINGSTFSIKVQINTDTGIDDMGGATMPISYDHNFLSMPSVLVNGIHYIYHNFSGGNYSVATVTRNNPDGVYQIWLNIDLPFNSSNNGTIVAQSPNWTDVVTLNFTILNTSGNATIVWLTNSMFWGIYDGNNTTFWNTGALNNLEYALPVELSAFTAQQLGDDVELLWTTETEVNNYGFDIERKVNDTNWNKIGFISGAGNSNSQKHYQFIDGNIIGGSEFHYRLKQIDNDGSFEYSDEVEVVIVPDNFTLEQNYPNPFNPTTIIRYAIPKTSFVSIKVYDLNGQEIISLINETKEVGTYEIKFDARGFASGVYLYRMVAEDYINTKKLLLLK